MRLALADKKHLRTGLQERLNNVLRGSRTECERPLPYVSCLKIFRSGSWRYVIFHGGYLDFSLYINLSSRWFPCDEEEHFGWRILEDEVSV